MPVRLSYFGGMFTGIGGVILVVAIWLPSLTLYIASYVLLALVVLISVLNTFFREKGIVGFVHPDELRAHKKQCKGLNWVTKSLQQELHHQCL